MKIESYVFHIYCDNGIDCVGVERRGCDCVYGDTQEISARNRREAIKIAKQYGWIVGRHDYCPKCVKARRRV